SLSLRIPSPSRRTDGKALAMPGAAGIAPARRKPTRKVINPDGGQTTQPAKNDPGIFLQRTPEKQTGNEPRRARWIRLKTSQELGALGAKAYPAAMPWP